MIYSMTGYGASHAAISVGTVDVELKSVNNRYLDIRFRWPHAYASYEGAARSCIGEEISRGSVTMAVSITPDNNAVATRIDTACARAYMKEITALATELECSNDVTLDTILKLPGVVRAEPDCQSDDDIWKELEPAIKKALAELKVTRRQEGVQMARDIGSHLTVVENRVSEIIEAAPDSVSAYQERLDSTLNALMEQGMEYDMSRVLTEIGIFSERLDINEECVRLKAHCAHMRHVLDEGGVCGKRLDFILQEMFREITTIGNKASSAVISTAVVAIKEELDKMREMAQNIE